MNARTPHELFTAVVTLGEKKVASPLYRVFILSLLAGVYIGFSAHLATVASVGEFSWLGGKKIVMGAVFSLGLILVVITGAELFTGNCLMLTALLARKISAVSVLLNWIVVYIGNFIGALLLGVMMVHGTGLLDGVVGVGAVEIASAKVNLSSMEIFFRGVGANWLVCLAIVVSLASSGVVGKSLGLFFPVMAFVAIGFEHSIANMYFLPAGIMALDVVSVAGLIEEIPAQLNWGGALRNIVWATLGNVIGGGVLVGGVYWLVERRVSRA